MCAIFGIGFQRGHSLRDNAAAKKLLRNMFLENERRGRTSSGLAYVSPYKISVIKKDVKASDFIFLPEYRAAEDEYINLERKNPQVREVDFNPISIIGHCRQKTKGTEKDNKNNHPIVRSRVVGVHNGIISNDDQLFEDHETHFNRNGRVDSEIIFALIEHYSGNAGKIDDAIKKAVNELWGSMACAMVHKCQPYIVWLFRLHSPCTIMHFPDTGIILWSSEDYYIENATADLSFLGKPVEIPFPAKSGIAFDFYKNRTYRFGLKEEGAYAHA